MPHDGKERFSAIRYGLERSIAAAPDKTMAVIRKEMEEQDAELSGFEGLVEDIRSQLIAAKGRNEEERKQYSELLNRAILGFPPERQRLLAMIQDILLKKRVPEQSARNRKYGTLADAVFAEVIGFNVLELSMKDREGLEELQVVGTKVFEVRNGSAFLSPYSFSSIQDVERVQQNLVLFNHDTMNPRKRWAEVMLTDGSRVTLTGFGFTSEPSLTIRFFQRSYFTLEALCHPDVDTIDENIRRLLLVLLRSYFNLIVIGSTNTGKTNLLKALIAEMPDQERIITIEGRYELMLKRDYPEKNIIEYEIDEEDPRHNGRQAFKLSLRQSPKRIVHAEIRDDDANIYVRACTRGHEGSITTVHVNALEDAPDAITDMCMLDNRVMNPERLRKRITQYVTQFGIEMAMVDGKRKLVRIGEYAYKDGEVIVNDIMKYDYVQRCWIICHPVSSVASHKIRRNGNDGLDDLVRVGLLK